MSRILIFFLFLSPLAFAAEGPQTYDRISLSARAGAEVANDVLTAVLYVQREGPRPADLAREVNRAVAWGIERARKVPGLEVRTLDYQTIPLYKDRTLRGWRVRQSLRLQSKDSAALSELIGTLQQRLALASVGYRLSPGQREQAENRLIVKALEAFGARAREVTKTLGRKDYRIVKLDISTSGGAPRPYLRTMRVEAAAAPAPVLEAGKDRVEVRVSGVIELALP